jgi:parvulin-like peptidyl-prolyl isomerase
MVWRRILALSSLAAGLAAFGCVTDSLQKEPTVAERGLPQDGAGGVVLPGAMPPLQQTRSQKPDAAQAPPSGVRLAAARGEPAATIRVVINNEAILEEEIRAICSGQMLGARSAKEQAEIYKQTLKLVIDREVVLQEAFGKLGKTPAGAKVVDKLKEDAAKEFETSWITKMVKSNHLSSEEELKSFLHEHGMSFDMIRRHWERQWLASQYIHYRVGAYLTRVGHIEIADYYDRHQEDFRVTDSVEWQDLFIDAAEHRSRAAARAFADVLADRARRGESFAVLAEQYDRGDSKLRQFKGVGTHKGEVRPPEAEAPLFRMQDGDIAVVEIGSGFHVIRLVHRETAHRRPFDDSVQKEIVEKLKGEMMQREIERLVNDLRRLDVIVVYVYSHEKVEDIVPEKFRPQHGPPLVTIEMRPE